MRVKCVRLPPMLTTSLILAALVIAVGPVHADDTISVGYNSNLPTAWITMSTDNKGHTTKENLDIGPYTNVSDKTNPGALPSTTAFCIDMWHNMKGGDSFQGTVTTTAQSTIGSMSGWLPFPKYTGRESDPLLTNHVNFLGALSLAFSSKLSGGAYNDAMGAIQLAVWYLTDKHFAVSGVANDPHKKLLADYNALRKLLSGTNQTIEGVKLTGYSNSQTGTYPVGTLVSVNRGVDGQATYYQNMIAWGTAGVQSVPEPSTLAIGGMGALAFLGYGLRRRKAMGG